MRIEHKSKDPARAERAAAPAKQAKSDLEAFIEAFVADHAKDPGKLTPRLRAFVEARLPKKDKANQTEMPL